MSSLKQFLYDKSNKSEVDQYFEDQAKFLLEKQKLETIDNFNGYFDFLNNEYPCAVYYEGLIYKTVSHAFQAARSTEQHIREKIVRADTVIEMYEIATKIDDPPDWLKIRLKIMETLIRDKFRRNTDLREKLRATETRRLVNTYADPSPSNLFWGVVDGEGQNQLGRILENIRNDIHHNMELEKWMFMTFNLDENRSLLPKIQLEVFKGDAKVENLSLEPKSYYFMGKLTGSDILMAHQSISRRHAVLICDSQMGVCILDLGSKGGSFLNNQKIDNCFPYRLKPGDTLNFGASTRRYKIGIDYTDVERYLLRKQRDMKKQFEQLDVLNNPSANPEAVKATLGVLVNDQIFVGGLPENCSHKELEQLFAKFGEVKNVNIPIDRKTGKTRTFALITFKEPKDCQKAVDADVLQFKERRLRIKWAEKRNNDDDRPDQAKREKYAQAVKAHEDKVSRDVSKRHKRRSRSPRDSGRRRKDREHSRDRNKRRRSREKKRKKSRSKSSSSSDSGSSDSSSSKSRSREREKKKKGDESSKAGQKEKAKRKEEKDSKDKNKRNRSESESKSRSRSKDKAKKNGTNKKKESVSEERKNEKSKNSKKKEQKSESESESSSEGSESNSSGDESGSEKGDK